MLLRLALSKLALNMKLGGDVLTDLFAFDNARPGHHEQRRIEADFYIPNFEITLCHVYPKALIILVLIPAGFAPSGTITFTARGMTVMCAGSGGPGSPSISV